MCLTAFAIGLSARFPFVLLANRDERFDRPAAPMAWWPAQAGAPALLAGRDLSAGGTWLGLTAGGRLAWVTNVREPGRALADAPSRGSIVPQWLQAAQAVPEPAALQALGSPPRNGFNLVVAELASAASAGVAGVAHWVGNRPQLQHRVVGRGMHGVSNAALDTPWPKLLRLKQRLADMLLDTSELPALQEAAWAALADPQPAADAQLPATGLPLLRERQLSPAFIRIVGDDPALAVYGTRCSTVVAVQQAGRQRSVHVVERSFGPGGEVSIEVGYDWALPGA
jgi:uncharacterized protein with NRDE domain